MAGEKVLVEENIYCCGKIISKELKWFQFTCQYTQQLLESMLQFAALVSYSHMYGMFQEWSQTCTLTSSSSRVRMCEEKYQPCWKSLTIMTSTLCVSSLRCRPRPGCDACGVIRGLWCHWWCAIRDLFYVISDVQSHLCDMVRDMCDDVSGTWDLCHFIRHM